MGKKEQEKKPEEGEEVDEIKLRGTDIMV